MNGRNFVKSELKGLLVSFWGSFWKSTLLLALLFSVWLAIRMWTDTPDPSGYQPPDSLSGYFFDGLIIFGLSLFYVLPLGILCGAASICWRLFGAWTLFPLFIFPLVLWGLFWLTSGFLAQQGLDIIDALRLAYQNRGMPGTSEVLGGARVAHAGGPAAIIVLIFLIPPLLMDSLRLITDPGVLWQLSQFLLSLGLACILGILVSSVISAIPLLRAFYKRLKSRRMAFQTK